MTEYRFDLIRPCEHCPFLKEGGIRFSCEERTREIEESAYRNGFVCHEHAEWVEEEDDPIGGGGAYARQDGSSQHCFGALAMYLRDGNGGNVPWQHALDEDEELEERWWSRVGKGDFREAMRIIDLIWENEDDFIKGAIDRGRPTRLQHDDD